MKIDLTTEDDEFFDYCHYKYTPDADYINKFRSNNLLAHSFNFMKVPPEFNRLVRILQEKIGVKNTVWGAKNIKDSLLWEFYFYNWEKKDPKINISNILNIVKPSFGCDIKPNENLPYFMFSIDITPDFFKNKKLDCIHVYIGEHSYLFDGTKVKLENYYSFFDPKEQLSRIAANIKHSACVDFSKIRLREVLLPQLIKCKKICVSKKQQNDAVYFSRISLNQFLYFLKRFEYPQGIIEFIESNKTKLDHLRYDVGFDYKMEDGKLKILKSGYYGTF